MGKTVVSLLFYLDNLKLCKNGPKQKAIFAIIVL